MKISRWRLVMLGNFTRLEKLKARWRHYFTGTGLFLLSMLVISGILGLDIKRSLAIQAFTLLLAMFMVSLLFAFRFKTKMTMRRILPSRVVAGQPVHYSIIVENHGAVVEEGLELSEIPRLRFPTTNSFLIRREPGEEKRNIFDRHIGYYRWLWLLHQGNPADFKLLSLPKINPGQSVTLEGAFLAPARGVYSLPAVRVFRRDPLGLVRAGMTIECPDTYMVLPRTIPIGKISLPAKKSMVTHPDVRVMAIGEAEEFTSLRDYRPGDSMHHIHWKSTAKTGQLVVREYRDETQSRQALMLDTSATADDERCFEAAITLAASLFTQLKGMESIIDLLFMADRMVCISRGRGMGDPRQALEALAGLQPGGPEQWKQLERGVLGRTPLFNGLIAILLSWDEPRREFIRSLLTKNCALRVLLVLPRAQHQGVAPGPMTGLSGSFHLVDPADVEQGRPLIP